MIQRREPPGTEKVFVISWHKTATMSLSRALAILGYPCWHCPFQLFPYIKEDPRNLSLLNSWPAAADMPIPLIFKNLHGGFPHARFILSTRPTTDWLASVEKMFSIGNRSRASLGGRSLWDIESETRYTHQMNEWAYGTRYFDRELFARRYQEHNRTVRNYFGAGKGRFLEIDLSGDISWIPLCQFLERPEPTVSFPHLNAGNLDTFWPLWLR